MNYKYLYQRHTKSPIIHSLKEGNAQGSSLIAELP